jgi:hypothetical protein
MVDISESGVKRFFLPGDDLPDAVGKDFVPHKFV